MDKDNKNNKNDQPTEEQQPSDENQVEYRELSDEEKHILEDHEKWLQSDGKEGNRADFSRANLSETPFYDTNLSQAYFDKANLYNAGFSGVNLQKAIFSEAKLQKAKFYQSDLQKATFDNCDLRGAKLHLLNLQKTNFSSADLSNASLVDSELNGANLCRAKMQNTTLVNIKSFADSELHYANLEGATGLLGNEFAQADVTGTKLPDDIKDFKALETVKETSQNARKIFFAMLLGCVYSWLTIATTTDVRLLTNTASSPLPIIGTEIPIAWFYVAAPLVLICLYFYFHLYLDNLWKSLAGLPAIFPDGKPLDQKAYPWLLNSLVCRHFERLKKRSKIAHLKEWITIILAWWVVPITMIAFWLRYIPRHDWFGTYFHIGLIVVSIVFAIVFYRLCALILRGKDKTSFRFLNFRRDRRFFYGVSVLIIGALFFVLSYGAINVSGDFPRSYLQLPDRHKIEDLVPYVFWKAGYTVYAEFREKDVSEKPSNYWEINKEERLYSVKGANLNGINMKNANFYKAFVVKGDLRDANLQDTYLNKANFQNANLLGANLQNANLENTNLQNANLSWADLTGVKELTVNQLSKVRTLYSAKLDPELLEKVKKCCPDLLEQPKE